jgi:hypothetical protein
MSPSCANNKGSSNAFFDFFNQRKAMPRIPFFEERLEVGFVIRRLRSC